MVTEDSHYQHAAILMYISLVAHFGHQLQNFLYHLKSIFMTLLHKSSGITEYPEVIPLLV